MRRFSPESRVRCNFDQSETIDPAFPTQVPLTWANAHMQGPNSDVVNPHWHTFPGAQLQIAGVAPKFSPSHWAYWSSLRQKNPADGQTMARIPGIVAMSRRMCFEPFMLVFGAKKEKRGEKS